MKHKDCRKIKEIIEQEIKIGNIEGLKRLRDYLDEQIDSYKPSYQADIDTEERFDILSLELETFLTAPTYGLKFFRNDLVQAIKRIRDLKRVVLVVDSIGIGKNVLLEEKGIGQRTIGKYEHALNRYGYSLNRSLTEAQEEQFKIYQKKKF
jgi:hypothetical protein